MDQNLVDFIKLFAAENRTTVADVITQYPLALERKSEGQSTVQILSHPALHEAVEQVQAKLQDGTARWHSFDEVFKD